MSGLQLMIPPFVACIVLVAMLSYLGLHVIAREVIFVDLSLAQMAALGGLSAQRSEEHTSELQSRGHLVCRLLLEKKKPDRPRVEAPPLLAAGRPGTPAPTV